MQEKLEMEDALNVANPMDLSMVFFKSLFFFFFLSCNAANLIDLGSVSLIGSLSLIASVSLASVSLIAIVSLIASLSLAIVSLIAMLHVC